ncbi:MAG: hypothetical protein AAF492_11935 [Verrucomicrobiota bacterium]
MFICGSLLFLTGLPGSETLATEANVVSFNFRDAASAGKAWQAQDASPAAKPTPYGLRFYCPFKGDTDRVHWDRHVSLNLANFTSFELALSCDHPEALRSLALYFKSGDGWYIWNKPIPQSGHQRLAILKSEFSVEGQPKGWHAIERVRLSPWKGESRNTHLIIQSLTARTDSVLIVEGTSSLPNKTDRAYGRRVAKRISKWLREMQIPHGLVTDDEVTTQRLSGVKVVLLPYQMALPARERQALEGFINRGGKLMVFYSGDDRLARAMGLQLGPWLPSERPGRWNAIAFTDPAAHHVPERIYQEAWNLRVVKPKAGHAKTIAWWEDASGRRSPEPAMVASRHGYWMTHVPLDGDNERKKQMFAGLICSLHPALWPATTAAYLNESASIEEFGNAVRTFETLQRAPVAPAVKTRYARLVETSRRIYQQAMDAFQAGDYPTVLQRSARLRRMLEEAYAMTQPRFPGGMRAVWDHKGSGLYPGDWDRTCRLLAEHGITAVFANLAWGGMVHYKSGVLPSSKTYARFGDQLAQCAAACRKYGLQLHVWLVCWNLDNAPAW